MERNMTLVTQRHSEINFSVRRGKLPQLGKREHKVSGYLSIELGGVTLSIAKGTSCQILDVARSNGRTIRLELDDAQASALLPFCNRDDISEVRIAKRDGKRSTAADAWVMKVKVGPIGEPTEQVKITLTQSQRLALFHIADTVEKRRAYIPVALATGGSVIVEVDEYPDGLMMAEVPSEAIGALRECMPPWLGEEILEADAKHNAWRNIRPAQR